MLSWGWDQALWFGVVMALGASGPAGQPSKGWVSCVSSKKGCRVQRVLRGKPWVLPGEVALCPIPGMEKALLLVPKPVAPRCLMSGAKLGKEDSRPETSLEVCPQGHLQGLSGGKHRILNKDIDEQLNWNTGNKRASSSPGTGRAPADNPLAAADCGHRAGVRVTCEEVSQPPSPLGRCQEPKLHGGVLSLSFSGRWGRK